MRDMSALQSASARAAEAARAGRIDTRAPVQATTSIEVDAEAATTLAVLADLDAWPEFIPGVTRMRLSGGAVAPGIVFRWRNQGFPLTSMIQRLDAGSLVCWTGRAGWIVAAHCNTVTPLPDGRCRLTSSESMAGLGIAWMMPSNRLEQQLRGFVHAVAAEAERRCA